jgi:hypothetical protein
MDHASLIFWLTVADTLCWPICFVWMHRLSSRQNNLLREIREQGKRIEKLSRSEHDLIREVHPRVSEIKETLETVSQAVTSESSST